MPDSPVAVEDVRPEDRLEVVPDKTPIAGGNTLLLLYRATGRTRWEIDCQGRPKFGLHTWGEIQACIQRLREAGFLHEFQIHDTREA